MKRAILIGFLIMLLAVPVTSWAAAKLKISDDTQLSLGLRIQNQFISTNDDSGGDGSSHTFWKNRRQRFRLGGSVTEYVKFFLQTDGSDVSMIDAFINVHYKNVAQFIMGHNMAPASRQITTSSGGLMAIDRPAIVNKNLSWGLAGNVNFNNTAFAQGDLSLAVAGPSVRDDGITFFSSNDFSDTFHGKFYLGVYNGMDNNKDNKRVTARAQVNFFDPEPGYYNLSTYLGKKKTVGIGVSYDAQSKFAFDDSKGWVDYTWYEADVFAELPVGPGTLTAEVSYQNLDMDDAKELRADASGPGGAGSGENSKESAGEGFYGQIGYYLEDLKIQPWAGIDYWDSDGSNDIGSFTSYRIGITYFFKGHNANIKVGYERFEAEQSVGNQEDNIDTFLTGFYITF